MKSKLNFAMENRHWLKITSAQILFGKKKLIGTNLKALFCLKLANVRITQHLEKRSYLKDLN